MALECCSAASLLTDGMGLCESMILLSVATPASEPFMRDLLFVFVHIRG